MKTDPYTSPQTSPHLETPSPVSSKWLSRIAIILYMGPIWGILGTIIGIIRAFGVLETGDADPSALAGEISTALISTMVGLGLGLIGTILILIILFTKKNRQPKFFWTSITLSIIWCITLFPYGLIVGLPMIALFCSRKSEFTQNKTEL